DMLNTKYFILSAGKDKEPRAQMNPAAMGNAWFVDSIMVVANADEELNRIGNMYEVQTLDGSNFTVNGKPTNKTLTGNHDNVVINDAKFDASDFGFSFGMADTFGVSTRMNKETGAQENYVVKADAASGNKKFAAQFVYTFNPHGYAVVDKRFEEQVKNFKSVTDSSRNIKLVSYQPNNLVYESNSTTDAMVVFSEIYYSEGWDVFVDGKKSDYFRCNYVLRGMKLQAGKHKIEWKFEPASYYTGENVAMISSIVILLLFFGVVGMEAMKWRKNEN
ncbi:MAG: YfhO family protein, partial [Bacteroidota bacterium]